MYCGIVKRDRGIGFVAWWIGKSLIYKLHLEIFQLVNGRTEATFSLSVR